ncbi:MAG: helix-turn-helix transcriptional regulator [Rubrivivax sp.]|nr:helix-turn-helix transcriptional regulator [Rubrivivax sp.]
MIAQVAMILTQLPDLPPRPLTAGNAEFRRRFYARWGRENAVVCGRARHAEYAEHPQTLSLKMAGGGRERYLLGPRDVVVDDDSYLVLDEGARYGSVLSVDGTPRGGPAWTFAIFFRPGLAADVAAARTQRTDAALELAGVEARAPAFAPHLRPHGDAVSAGLRAIARAIAAGERDELWLEEQCVALLATLLGAEARAGAGRGEGAPAHGTAGRAAPRAAQRAELRRRLHLAADFMHAHHAEPLTLDQLAAEACLSRYHFVREFARAFGLSPHAWLTRKRARVAWRLLARGETDREAVALRCGFGSRWSLARALARHDAPADVSPTPAAWAASAAAFTSFAQDPHAPPAPGG